MNRMEQAVLRYQHSAYPLEIASTTHHWSGNLVNGEREQVWNAEELKPLAVTTKQSHDPT